MSDNDRDRRAEAAIDAATATTTQDGYITATVRLVWSRDSLPRDPKAWVTRELRDASVSMSDPDIDVLTVEVEAA